MNGSLTLACQSSYIQQMEDEKKKFLLSRIKREQTIIIIQFQKYKKIYHSREVSLEKNESFLEQISHTIQINNSLASSLYEYLDKNQMQAVFTRINTIFCDLIDKYRKCNSQLTFLQSNHHVKEIREICDVCHQKIQSNRIENIRKGLDEESECRAAVIKKLIEDSELERTTPVFSEEEDKQFKRQLEKVFKNKELVLQTNIHESNVFLATVEEEMAEFMVTFRKDFAQWGGQQIEQQNQNWGKLMKSYINKKLTNSFNSKIPNWIKKMHELFVDRQPTKPKQYFMNKECQVGIPTEVEEKLTQQLQQLNHSLIIKREALKDKQRELQYEKIRSKALKSQLESLQQYYVDKLYANSKDGSAKQKMVQLEEILANDSVRTSVLNMRDSNEAEKTQLNQREIESRSNKSKKKFAKLAYQMMIQKSPKQLRTIKQPRQRKNNQNSSFSHNKSFAPTDSRSQKSKDNILSRKQSLLTSFQGNNSIIDQGNLKLKRKAYNRQKREQVLSDYNKDKKNPSVSYLDEKQIEKSQLKDEVKFICEEISKDLRFKKISKSNNTRRFDSISVTEDPHLPQIQEQPKSPSAYILPSSEISSGLLHKQAISSDVKKRGIHINETLTKEINKMEINQVIDQLVQLSKCQNMVTTDDKARLNKMIQKFFNNLDRINSKSICFQPVKMSKVVLSGNKENGPLSPCKAPEYVNLSKSLKKEHRKQNQSFERKNKSLHTHLLKLPAISIKNYNLRETQEASISKDSISFFIDEAKAQEFEESFDLAKDRNIVKPTPSQLQEIQKMYSQLQLLKRRDNITYIQFCNFLRFPFSSTKQKSPLVNLASGFSFSTFCNYFLKVLWLHRDCPIEQGNKFCAHIQKFERKLLSNFGKKQSNRIKRTERLEIINGLN